MTTLQEIEALTETYADRRDALAEMVESLELEIAAAKKIHLPAIRHAAYETAAAKDALAAALDDGKALFEKPRTRVFHGVKVGWAKAKGSIAWASAERVVSLIRKTLGDAAEDYLIMTEKPNKTALATLDATTLRRLGVEVVHAGDERVIKPTAGDVDKLVDALLSDTGTGEAP